MTPRAVVSSVDEPPGRSDLGGRRTPQLQVRATAVPAEAGRGRRSGSPQVKPTVLTLPRPWVGEASLQVSAMSRRSVECRLGGNLFRGAALEVPDDSLQAWPAASTGPFTG